MNLKEIIKKHPSICYHCRNARRPASDENIKKGYVGCVLFIKDKHWTEVSMAKELAEGWVDLRATVHSEKGSGIITNFQLITLEVEICSQYEGI